MAIYSPESIGIKSPLGGFQQGGWYNGRQYWAGTLSEPNVIHPSSNQVGAGQVVSQEVVAQSAAAQGKKPEEFTSYFEQERQRAAKLQPTSVTPSGPTTTPSATTTPTGTGAGAEAGAGGAIIQPQPTLNLPELYKTLYGSSGISDLETDLSQKDKEYTEAKGSINDNPFLSEATRVGRIAKLEKLYQERTANLRGDIATKKADIETQLNLQTKQFDINSQAARDALNQFNTLLSMGALDGAGGEDIANITRATGISSSMIQSAITANKAKNVKTQVIQSTNDAGVVTISVVNTETGEVVKKTSLGAIGNVQEGRQPTESEKKVQYVNALKEDASSGATLAQIFSIYSGYLTPNEIINLYNATSSYGPAKETEAELKKYGVKPLSSSTTGDLINTIQNEQP